MIYTDAGSRSRAYNLLQQRDLYDHRGEVTSASGDRPNAWLRR
jgi:hypothetical protein